jgi:hypothetical protein
LGIGQRKNICQMSRQRDTPAPRRVAASTPPLPGGLLLPHVGKLETHLSQPDSNRNVRPQALISTSKAPPWIKHPRKIHIKNRSIRANAVQCC